MMKRVCVSRKCVPKRKAGIPLDELLAAHVAGDDARLATLMARQGSSVVRGSTIAAKPVSTPNRPKTAPNKAPGARLARPDDSQVVTIAEPRLVGYARVSTDEQTTALQLDALRVAGCALIHEDSASGASRSRPGLGRALEDLRAGDTLVVWRLDRLGRSLRDLLDISEMLRERDVALRSLTDHIDTGTAAGRMLYAVLGAVAQFERDVLRERTVAGCAPRRNGVSTSAVHRPSRRLRFGKRRRCSSAARVRTTSPASCASADLRCIVQSDEQRTTPRRAVESAAGANLVRQRFHGVGRENARPAQSGVDASAALVARHRWSRSRRVLAHAQLVTSISIHHAARIRRPTTTCLRRRNSIG